MIPILTDYGYVFTDLGPDGGPYDEMEHPKVVIHTTEGSSLAGAESTFRLYPPHLGYDPIRRIKKQYIRLDRHSYALRGAENDDEYCIQVEIVGFAAQTHTWSDEIYSNIGQDVIAPLREAIRVPDRYRRFYRSGEDGIVLATATSPIRFSDFGFRVYSGWIGHQHVPAPDSHWDPGGFLMDKAFIYSYPQEDNMNEQDASALIWRIEALLNLRPRVAGGVCANEPVPLVDKLNELFANVSQIRSDTSAIKQMLATLVGTGQAMTLVTDGVLTIRFAPVEP